MMLDAIEALVRYARSKLTEELSDLDDKSIAISCAGLFQSWVPDSYKVGDIRTKDGVPYECILDHDSIVNPTWDITVRTLWKPYHSRQKNWALPWTAPTGAHDVYKAGEYMIYDGKIYLCKSDTAYSPSDYAAAWEEVE